MTSRSTPVTLVCVLLMGGLLGCASGLDGQLVPRPAVSQMNWQLGTVRSSGQPVVPMFEGWYQNENGTYRLCFGFFNLNREEAIDIPLGPDNFIEPARFDGVQPTHFPALGTERIQREYCVFSVSVPADIGGERVWWNLRRDGHTYRVPGHVTARPWRIDNLVNSVGAASMDFSEDGPIGGSLVAPVVEFVDPPGPQGRGKDGFGIEGVTARVGDPLSLTISVAQPNQISLAINELDPDEEGVLAEQSLKWTKFSGPIGAVTFAPQRSEFDVGPVPSEQTTSVTFSEPGDYVLLVQVLSGSFSSQCCWTDAYVSVTVTQ